MGCLSLCSNTIICCHMISADKQPLQPNQCLNLDKCSTPCSNSASQPLSMTTRSFHPSSMTFTLSSLTYNSLTICQKSYNKGGNYKNRSLERYNGTEAKAKKHKSHLSIFNFLNPQNPKPKFFDNPRKNSNSTLMID